MALNSRFAAAAAAILLVLLPTPAHSQQRGARVGRFEVPGMDFSTDGAWRKRTRQIRLQRQGLMRNGAFGTLNAPGRAGPRITGTYNVPVVLISYSNVAIPFSTSSYQDVLFNPTPVAAYSVKTYYQQVSRNAITMNGVVFNAVVTSFADTYYEDGCDGIGLNPSGQGVNCQHPGLNGTSARFGELLTEVLGKVDDGSVNWGQFDNDGPDEQPNSGDDDGFVDFISFIQPEVDGACGTSNIWAHRFTIGGVAGSSYVTKTGWAGHAGQFIKVRDYTIQSGQGGNGACTGGQIMPIGTIAHETGHAFGLPDLYDTSGNTEGIGEWGIMGSGNYSRPYSPSMYDAWSLSELGWINLDTLSTSGVVTLNPVQTSDIVMYVPIPNTDEYLLLENRDSSLSDTAQMNSAFGSRKKNPGLLIWHIDQGQVNSGQPSNSVNSGPIQGVALEQADGLNELRTFGGDRGDAGDSYPGSTFNRRYTFTTTPGARDNQGAFDGFGIDSITRNALIPLVGSPIVFRFTKRPRSLFTTNRNGAVVKVNSVSTTAFNDVVAPGDIVQLDVVTPQTITAGRTQLTFLSWSDAGASAHPVTSSASQPDTVIASFTAKHKVNLVSAPSGGTVTSDIAGSPNLVVGFFGQEGLPITLTAAATAGGTFVRWQGDTTTTNASLILPMNRPYSLTAVFSGSVVIVTQDAVNALLGVACAQSPCLNQAQLDFMDQSGNNDGSYNLGDFLAYADRSGLNASSPAMQQLLSKPTISVPLSGPAKQ
ncbi:MAG: M6 family metalloprotease domain-containing protein [Gemmatimonadota bacterium]